jgi:hypothetical protein
MIHKLHKLIRNVWSDLTFLPTYFRIKRGYRQFYRELNQINIEIDRLSNVNR